MIDIIDATIAVPSFAFRRRVSPRPLLRLFRLAGVFGLPDRHQHLLKRLALLLDFDGLPGLPQARSRKSSKLPSNGLSRFCRSA